MDIEELIEWNVFFEMEGKATDKATERETRKANKKVNSRGAGFM